MTPELKHRSAVLIANQFNPTIFQQPWMIKHEILLDEEATEFIQTPVFVQARTNSFELLVVPERVQISFPNETSNQIASELTLKRLGDLVKVLPETPYSAVGLNFLYHIAIDRCDTPKISRGLFTGGSSILSQVFPKDADVFGAYAVTQTDFGKLGFEVRPAMLKDNKKRDILEFKLNYSQDLRDFEDEKQKVDRIHGALSQWAGASEHAYQLVENFVGN